MEENNHTSNQTLILDEYGKSNLYDARKWSMFLAVTGFVIMGLMILFTLFGMRTAMNSVPGMGIISIIIMLIVALIYFFPLYYLYKFSSLSKNALEAGDSVQLSEAFKFLKMHYTFMGILLIIGLVIYLILFIIAMVTGSFFWMNQNSPLMG